VDVIITLRCRAFSVLTSKRWRERGKEGSSHIKVDIANGSIVFPNNFENSRLNGRQHKEPRDIEGDDVPDIVEFSVRKMIPSAPPNGAHKLDLMLVCHSMVLM
tara:strand:+ start:233 stop:541 length:309 start_codon:yes stop_codon:yes gene_type:complete